MDTLSYYERGTNFGGGAVSKGNGRVQADSGSPLKGEDAGHTRQNQEGTDPIERPFHYTRGKIEAIDAIESAIIDLDAVEAYHTGQCLKYLFRWKRKVNPIEDLKKARWYLDRLISYAEKDAD
jgi:hypothetical protein